jgi:polysaccharide pyruvyl transferase WcaK-like protein
LVINLAGDMPEVRYGAASKAGFASHITGFLNAVLHRHDTLDCVFAPHIYSDLGLIAECLDRLDDRLRRTRVSVAPYMVRPQDWRRVFGTYRDANAVLAMRFHANLCAAGMGSPVTGLSTHHKIVGLYEGLSLSDRCHTLKPAGDFGETVAAAIGQAEADIDPAIGEHARSRQKQVRDAERARLKGFHAAMDRWLAERL